LTALIQRFVYRVPKVTRTHPDLDKMVSDAIEQSETIVDQAFTNLQGKNIFTSQTASGNGKDMISRNVLLMQEKHYQ